MGSNPTRPANTHPARQYPPGPPIPTRPANTHPASFEHVTEPTIHGSACPQIVKYLVNLENSGYRPETISSHSRILRLLDKSCKLEDPESVRQFIASRHVSSGRKENIVYVYSKYSKSQGIAFDKPRYSREDTLPFIPLEKEVLAIIDATRHLRHAGLLRLVYETGMRVGEASRLQFRDFDFEKRTVRVIPEKGPGLES